MAKCRNIVKWYCGS